MNSFVEAGQLLSERYRLTSLFPEQLPYSGISVWSAIDTLLGTSLRLIILDPGAPNTTEALDSARRSSLIDDPHVVRILSVGQDASACYIATEVPLGTPLSHFLHGTPFSPEQAHALSGEIASALNSARSRGVRHLQLTSQQVRVGVLGEVFIDGLGVDAALAGMHTDSMETAQADRIEARGLSLLLACLLTGQPGGKPEALLRGVADNDRLPEQLRNVCARELKGVGALSPSDFVRELAPWGVISPGAFPQPVGGAELAGRGLRAGGSGAVDWTGPAETSRARPVCRRRIPSERTDSAGNAGSRRARGSAAGSRMESGGRSDGSSPPDGGSALGTRHRPERDEPGVGGAGPVRRRAPRSHRSFRHCHLHSRGLRIREPSLLGSSSGRRCAGTGRRPEIRGLRSHSALRPGVDGATGPP